MKIPLEEYIPYRLPALLVLAVFYGIYLVKQWAQKRRNIQTMQFGHGKDPQSRTVETLMGIATVEIIPAQLLSIGFGWSHLPANARFTGACVGMVGDLIFLISVLCMKDSWRAGIPDKDRTELVTDGIYKYSRNPAFLGFDLMYIGVFLMYCNLLTGMFTVFAIVTSGCQKYRCQSEKGGIVSLDSPILASPSIQLKNNRCRWLFASGIYCFDLW